MGGWVDQRHGLLALHPLGAAVLLFVLLMACHPDPPTPTHTRSHPPSRPPPTMHAARSRLPLLLHRAFQEGVPPHRGQVCGARHGEGGGADCAHRWVGWLRCCWGARVWAAGRLGSRMTGRALTRPAGATPAPAAAARPHTRACALLPCAHTRPTHALLLLTHPLASLGATPAGNAPTMMSWDDMKRVMPIFFNISIAVHNDPVASKEWGWVQVCVGRRGRRPARRRRRRALARGGLARGMGAMPGPAIHYSCSLRPSLHLTQTHRNRKCTPSRCPATRRASAASTCTSRWVVSVGVCGGEVGGRGEGRACVCARARDPAFLGLGKHGGEQADRRMPDRSLGPCSLPAARAAAPGLARCR